MWPTKPKILNYLALYRKISPVPGLYVFSRSKPALGPSLFSISVRSWAHIIRLWLSPRLLNLTAWLGRPALPHPICVILEGFLCTSVPQFPHLYHGT